MAGLRLRYWRNFRALTVRQLADKAGIVPATITKIENHGHIPTNTIVAKLANALEIAPNDLYEEGTDLSTLGKGHRQPIVKQLASPIPRRLSSKAGTTTIAATALAAAVN